MALIGLMAILRIAITYLKDFSGGLRESGQLELGKQLTTSTRNVRDSPPPEVEIPIANIV